MDSCDGHDGGSSGGLDGFDGVDYDAIDSVDLLSGADHDHALGDSCQGPEPVVRGVGVADDGDTFVVRVLNHGDAPLFQLFSNAAERAGLLRVAPILVGLKALPEQKSASILHTSSWNGAKKGEMPRGYVAGMTGNTTMFRQFYQIPCREWGFLSKPVYDKDASVFLDVSGMTWRFDATGDCETQLIIRVVPLTQFDSRTGQWCTQGRKVNAIRKVGRQVAEVVHATLATFRPSAKAVEARRVIAAPRAVARRTEPVEGIRQLVFSGGADLLSALVASPKYGARHTIASAIPPLTETREPGAPTREGVEMVTMRLSLPRRQTAVA